MNDEFKTVNFLSRFNKALLILSILSAIILIFLDAGSVKNPIYPFRPFGIMLIPISFVNFYILKLVINWAKDTIYIKLYNKELIDCNKEIKELLIKQTKFIEANLKKEESIDEK